MQTQHTSQISVRVSYKLDTSERKFIFGMFDLWSPSLLLFLSQLV